MNLYDEISEIIDSVEIVSFDIFDTLILRAVRNPQRIFNLTYDEAKECFPDYITEDDWRAIRSYLPLKVKEKSKGDFRITLDDYLSEVPHFINNVDRLHKAELEIEKKCAIINPDISDIMYRCKYHHGKKVILLSDMYLREDEIEEILISAGIKMDAIDKIFVSNEYGERKSSGGLFKTVCDEMRCEPRQILHIGDNFQTDYCNALNSGYKAILYPTISFATLDHPFLPYEGQLFGCDDGLADQLYALRCLAASHAMGTREEKDWFKMGAMTFGPLLTFGAKWVLDQAEANSIKNIYPFMREGLFLSKLLNKEAEYRGWEGNIRPLYISRTALFPALLSVIEKRDVFFSFLANTGISRNLTVGQVLEMYGVSEEDELYRYKDLKMIKARNTYHDGVSLTQIMNDRFFSQIEKTRLDNENADELLWDYLKEMHMDREDFITFDFGYIGTTQNAINRIIEKHNSSSRALHLLIMGKENILERGNFGSETEIRGFISTLSSNKRITDAVNRQICDSLLKCRCGSIRGYKKTDGKVTPIFAKEDYNENSMHMVEMFQEGVLEFQRIWHETNLCRSTKLECAKDELLKVLARLTVFPTVKEAVMLGELASDNEKIIDKSELVDYLNTDHDLFFADRFRTGIAKQWYQGMDAIKDGLRYYKSSKMFTPIEDEYIYSLYAKRVLDKYDNIVIVGNLREIRRFAWAATLLNEWEKTTALIMVDAVVEQVTYYGKKMISLSESQGGAYFVLLSKNKEEISKNRQEILEMYETATVIDLYS